jgi:alkylhydroperoxidase family enzyme
VDRCEVDDRCWTAAREHFSEVELLDIAMLAGFYGLASRLVLALEVDLEAGPGS